jgi:hypothetical protein
MWIEPRTGPGARTANAIAAHGEVVGSGSVAPPSAASPSVSLPSVASLSAASPSVLSPSAPEPLPAPFPALPAYVVVSGVRHVPICPDRTVCWITKGILLAEGTAEAPASGNGCALILTGDTESIALAFSSARRWDPSGLPSRWARSWLPGPILGQT